MQGVILGYETQHPISQMSGHSDVREASNDACMNELAAMLSDLFDADGVLLVWHRGSDVSMTASSGLKIGDPDTENWLNTVANDAARNPRSLRESIKCFQGERGQIAMTLAVPVSDAVFTISVLLRNSRSAWDLRSRDQLDRLAPMLRGYGELWLHQQNMKLHIGGLTAAVECSNAATFLMGRRCELLFANRAGKDLLEADCGLVERNGSIAASTISETLRLNAIVDHICSGEQADEGASVLALKREAHRPLMVAIGVAELDSCEKHERAAVVRVFDPEQDVARLLEPACRFYSLSPGETRLTCAMAKGDSLAQAASAIGIRPQTARSYLKQIFLKTETNRQAELVGLMLRSAMRTQHPRIRIF